MEKQRTKAWFAKRKGRITGSNIGAILGQSPFAKPKDVMRRMVREYHDAPSEFKGNIATEYGNLNEANAIADLELIMGITVKETGFHEYEDWLGASPDGLVGKDTVVEIKCPYSKRDITSVAEFNSIYKQPHYYAQVQFEMLCTGRDKCLFYQWTSSGVEMIEEVPFSQKYIDDALPILKDFYKDYLVEREENYHEHIQDTHQVMDDETATALVGEYIDAKHAIKDLQDRQKSIMSSLVEICGGEDSTINGKKLTHVHRKGSVSYSKIIKQELPDFDVEPFRGNPSEYWLLS